MIRNLSLTIENIVESTAKTLADKKLLRFSGKFVLDNRITLNSLLAEQGGVSSVGNTACCTWINTSGKVEIQLHKVPEQDTWLKKVTPSTGSFSDLFDFEWFGFGGPWL